MSGANDNAEAMDRGATLAALPGLLALARQVVVATLDAGDPETEALRALLEECVVGAHRICLREQLRMGGDERVGGC
ncbi:hypothetical protein ACO2Q3_02115 [Caulobacter sp. KR2-114]|uniref:hypothetical protein n=1 Tax=Caulobacter sp. KR2-114 TaxID=3400912 RepID=UPI003C082057